MVSVIYIFYDLFVLSALKIEELVSLFSNINYVYIFPLTGI